VGTLAFALEVGTLTFESFTFEAFQPCLPTPIPRRVTLVPWRSTLMFHDRRKLFPVPTR